MDIVDRVWEKGDGSENEDIANHVGRFSWVFDGATAIVKHDIYTPRWLVEQANDVFAHGAQQAQSLRDLFVYYKTHFYMPDDYLVLEPEERPSFAAAIIHQKDDGTLEHFHLADCYTVLKQGESIMILTDDDYATRSKRDAPSLQPHFYDLSKEEQHALQVARRRSINTPQGYWMGTADGAAFDADKIRETHITPDTEIMLCSDGFEAAIQAKIYNWSDIFTHNLGDVVTHLRQVEKNGTDMEKQGVLRVKKSDDATALKLRV